MSPFKTIFLMFLTLVVMFGGIYLAGSYYYTHHPVTPPQNAPVEMPVTPEPVKQPSTEPSIAPHVTPPSYKSLIMSRKEIVRPMKELINEEYETIYKSLEEGDQALKGGDKEKALQQYLSAYQSSIGSSMEQLTREKLLWVYETLGQHQSALEQVDWLLKIIDQRSPQHELYTSMRDDLLRKTLSKRQGKETT